MIEELRRNTDDEITYLKCLKTWREGINPKKKDWLEKMGDKLKVFLAKNEKAEVVGMIQVIPIEYSNCHGKNMAFIQCLLVNFYDQGVGNQHGKGYGKELLDTAISYARSIEVDGIAAWGTEFNGLETSKWYLENGFKLSESLDYTELLYLPFNDKAIKPSFVKRNPIPLTKGEITVSIFNNGWCTSSNVLSDIAREVASKHQKVLLKEYDTFDRNVFLDRGISEGVFVEDEQVIYFGEPFDEKIEAVIQKYFHYEQ